MMGALGKEALARDEYANVITFGGFISSMHFVFVTFSDR